MSFLLRKYRNLKALPKQLDFELCRQIENYWLEERSALRDVKIDKQKLPDKYILAMFPYSSGNLHIGHARVYYTAEIISNYQKLLGNKVIYHSLFEVSC